MPDGERLTLAGFLAAAAPELVGSGVSGALQVGGADPLSANAAGTAIALALRFDQLNAKQAVTRAGYVAHLASQEFGHEELERLATSDDIRQELMARVLRAAARTPLEDKLPALARVLADGLRDDAKVDEALVLAGALDDLEAPHVQVLALIVDYATPPLRSRFVAPMELERNPGVGISGWPSDQIAEHLPQVSLVLPALTQTLIRHGLIREPPAGSWPDDGEARLSSTDLGERCLALLRTSVAVETS